MASFLYFCSAFLLTFSLASRSRRFPWIDSNVTIKSLYLYWTTWKFSIKDFFSKCDQICGYLLTSFPVDYNPTVLFVKKGQISDLHTETAQWYGCSDGSVEAYLSVKKYNFSVLVRCCVHISIIELNYLNWIEL